MVNGKIDNLHRIEDMLSTYSELYFYDVAVNPELELKTDYLLVNHLEEMVLQLGMVKSDNKKVQEYHCNSFMVDYKKNDNYDLHYRNLTQRYEISKIVREDKITKRAEVIYQSSKGKADAEKRPSDKSGQSTLSSGEKSQAVKEAAAKWEISERRVQKLCEGNRIEGVMRFGHSWMIPKSAKKSHDLQIKKHKNRGDSTE